MRKMNKAKEKYSHTSVRLCVTTEGKKKKREANGILPFSSIFSRLSQLRSTLDFAHTVHHQFCHIKVRLSNGNIVYLLCEAEPTCNKTNTNNNNNKNAEKIN